MPIYPFPYYHVYKVAANDRYYLYIYITITCVLHCVSILLAFYILVRFEIDYLLILFSPSVTLTLTTLPHYA